jgi:hypothetical protein
LYLSAALAALLAAAGTAPAQSKRPAAGFGGIEALGAEAAKAKAQAWLKDAGKADAATQAKFDAAWSAKDRSVLDQLAATFELGSADAAKLLSEARNADVPAPTKVPDVLKDAKQPEFYRANLALAYARALCNRRVHEEALEALKLFTPEQTADPASYLFHRAVSEHAMLLKPEATKTIRRLLDEAAAASPDRYKTVALLMQLDMAAWRDKDLGSIARKMDNVERRLDLARGGEKTQQMQKEIVARLDEMIKKLEQQAKKSPGGT